MKNDKIDPALQRKISRRNFISFTTFIGLGTLAYSGWRWLYNAPAEPRTVTAGARKPLRRALNKTELLFRRAFSNNHLVKTYPKSMAAVKVRVNSNIGMNDPAFTIDNWQLNIRKASGQTLGVGMAELKALPKTEIIFDFKCVEGWNQIQHWAGVRFIDFIQHYQLGEEVKRGYVGMETPNGKYYVGLDMESAMHPQTLLAYEMNDRPLLPQHGAPLRLIIPVKYGIRSQAIGTIAFSSTRPRDYWAEFGYDYYSGL